MVSFVSTVRQRGSDLTLTKTENKLAELYIVAVIKVNLLATTVKIISEAWHFSATKEVFVVLRLSPLYLHTQTSPCVHVYTKGSRQEGPCRSPPGQSLARQVYTIKSEVIGRMARAPRSHIIRHVR